MATHGDSPTRPRHTHSVNYRSARVNDCRNTLTLDIPRIIEVTKDSLIDAAIVSLAPDVVEAVNGQLSLTSSIDLKDSDNPRWACLPEDPVNYKQNETKTFKFMEKIVEAIDNCRLKILPVKSKLKISVSGNTTPYSHRQNRSRPDGYFYLESADPSLLRWTEIVLPMEFKIKDSEENRIDDCAKVLWSMHHIMRTDARRRFVLGLTCENTTARLWYNDRSDIVASEVFDINKDWKFLVRIILSMLVATPIDMGYDPSVVPLKLEVESPQTEPQYDIIVRNDNTQPASVYRTTETISDIGADSAVGRGTRVWKCQQVENNKPTGPFYAIKAVWVHIDRPAEHLLIEKFRKKEPEYSKYFLTVVDHGFAPFNPARPSTLFDTHNPLGRPRNLQQTGNFLHARPLTRDHNTTSNSKGVSGQLSRDSVGGPEGISESPEGYHGVHLLSEFARRYYFVVFKEIGEPVHQLSRPFDAFTAILGGWNGLHAIHLCNHVHRDVSSGNILLVPESDGIEERGVIMDLEYCKDSGDTKPPHEVRTGTEAFMATEVAYMGYHRLTEERSNAIRSTSRKDMAARAKAAAADDLLSTKRTLPPFRHNPLHDMESIWWLCIWWIFYFTPSNELASAWQNRYRAVFRNRYVKRLFLLGVDQFATCTSHLSEIPELKPLVTRLGSWGDQLNDGYHLSYTEQYTSQNNPPPTIEIDKQMIDVCYNLGQEFLEKLRELSKGLSVEFVPLPRALDAEAHREAEPTTAGNSSELKADGPSATTSSQVIMPPPKKRRIDNGNSEGT